MAASSCVTAGITTIDLPRVLEQHRRMAARAYERLDARDRRRQPHARLA